MARKPRNLFKRTATTPVGSVGIEGADIGNGDGGVSLDGTGFDGLIIDPGTITDGGSDFDTGADSAGSDSGKRRGRRPGTARKKSGKALDINGVEMILYSGHMLLAGIAKTPEFAIEREEANQLATALESVAKHYDVEATEKSLAWINLTMCIGMIYGTRLIAIRNRKSMERRAAKSEENNVYTFPGQPE